MKTLKGIGISGGIAIGPAKLLRKTQVVATGGLLKDEAEIGAAILLFEQAVNRSVAEVESMLANDKMTLTEEEAAILETQIELLDDPQLFEDVTGLISNGRRNAGDAVITAIERLAEVFSSLDDEYLQARSADVKDAGGRILKNLGLSTVSSTTYPSGSVLVADELTPTETVVIDAQSIAGIVMQMGGKTSHAAIIARAKGIPAVSGCNGAHNEINDGHLLIVDGSSGTVIVNPAEDILAKYRIKKENLDRLAEKHKLLKDVEAVTADGVRVRLCGNISAGNDLEDVFLNGGEGAGLLRTEVLFMNRDGFPGEEEQFALYKQAALQAKGNPVIVRTIDIGGDKQLAYFNLPAEENPFLGYRAIRICLDQTDIFIVQLRAIMRASAFGDLKIMLPMISNVQELRSAKAIIEGVKAELLQQGIAFNRNIQTGIMIEVPSAAIMADVLATEADFFSIGTNDLCQYTLAVDRMNGKIAHLYDHFNPAVLRLIKYSIEHAQQQGIYVGMCGEMAGDPTATLLLLGMGLRDFSMSAGAIPLVKEIIVGHTLEQAREICRRVMGMEDPETIKIYLSTQ